MASKSVTGFGSAVSGSIPVSTALAPDAGFSDEFSE
jgi:hypothetical protein